MRHATAGVLPAFCAALAASVAFAQAPGAGGHSTFGAGAAGPVKLLAAEPESGDDFERPAFPPRIAQYPLENDPYEQPPQFPSDQRPVAPEPVYRTPGPSAPPLDTEEDTGWINLDQLRVTAGVLHDSPDGLGITDLVTTANFKTEIPGVTINPQFGAHFFGSSSISNIPDRTYDLSFELSGGMPINDDWIVTATISPGIFTDFEGAGGDVFRMPLRLLAFYKYSESLTLATGILWLDRPDTPLLPAVGLSYQTDDFKADLWFPRPKVSWLYYRRGDTQRWVYVVGELGGGTWSIRRDDGRSDEFAYRDFRAMVGFEQRVEDGLNWFAEGGLIFGRQVTFTRFDDEIDLDRTVGMQFGLRF